MTMTEGGAAGPGGPSEDEAPEFDIGAAAFYVFKRASELGWSDLRRLGIIYFIVVFLAYALMILAYIPFFRMMPVIMEAGDYMTPEEGAAVLSAMAPIFIALPFYLIGYLVFYAMVEAAVLRWLYGRGMQVRLNADAGRLMVVSLCWFGLFFVMYFVSVFVISLLIATQIGLMVALGVLLVFAALAGMIMFAVRMAPAAALSAYDERFRFFGAWKVTRGIGWPMLGVFVIIWVIFIGVTLAGQTALTPIFMMPFIDQMSSFPEPGTADPTPEEMEAMLAAFTSPVMIVGGVLYMIFSVVLAFCLQVMAAGANAYAVEYKAALHRAAQG